MLVKLIRVQDLPEGNRVHKVRFDDCGACHNIGYTRRSRSSILTSSVNGGAGAGSTWPKCDNSEASQ